MSFLLGQKPHRFEVFGTEWKVTRLDEGEVQMKKPRDFAEPRVRESPRNREGLLVFVGSLVSLEASNREQQ